jgi:alpha-1,2-mannosyltransferase
MYGHTFQDFGRFFYAARQWRQEGSLYGPSLATWLTLPSGEGMHLWNLNAPHVSILFWPLTFLSLEQAFAVWSLLTFFCLAFSAQMIVDALGLSPTRRSLPLLAAFVFASTPTLSYASNGNITGPLTLLCTWLWTQWRKGADRNTGIALGLGWSVKVFLAPMVVYLLWKRQWKAAGLAVLSGLAVFAVGALCLGSFEYVRWLQTIGDVQWPWLTINSSIVAPFTRFAFVGNGSVITAPQIARAARLGMAAAAFIAIAGMVTACRDHDRDRSMLMLLLTALLSFPLGWLYYWWIFAGPLVACLRWRAVRWSFWVSLPGWLIPMFLLWPTDSIWFTVSLGSVYTWSLLVLWCGCAICSWTAPDTSPATSAAD